jgi:cation diffusion facilitator CzcD-associated flavoprotein CzcO
MKERLDVPVIGAGLSGIGASCVHRSPTYIASMRAHDPIADFIRRALATLAVYELSQRKPDGYDIGTHFTPRYKRWDQRFCIVPGGDLFKAISAGSASIVTETYRAFEIPLSGAMAFS